VCSLQRHFAEVVGVSLVGVKDEVGVGVWDSLHNVVMVEYLCAVSSSQAEDGIWFHPGVDSCHDSGLAEGLGGEDCWVWRPRVV